MHSNLPVPTTVEAYRTSTDAASLCKEIVVESAMEIQGRKYVKVEGWQAIAVAHGCTASARDVERLVDGVRAIGEVRRMSDGVVIAEAEGFVGEDEPTWFGGETEVWDRRLRQKIPKVLPKRPDYAIRAMAQTRAISRACRSAFAHVVVMMNAGLQTTPAEEVPLGGFDDEVIEAKPARVKAEWPAGPHPNKTKARSYVRTMKQYGDDAQSVLAFDEIIEDAQPTLKQLEDANDAWWTGVDHEGNNFESIPAWIERRRRELSDYEANTTGSATLDAILNAMRQQTTRMQLAAWAEMTLDSIDMLTDEERRLFDVAYDQYEAGLTQTALLGAG